MEFYFKSGKIDIFEESGKIEMILQGYWSLKGTFEVNVISMVILITEEGTIVFITYTVSLNEQVWKMAVRGG